MLKKKLFLVLAILSGVSLLLVGIAFASGNSSLISGTLVFWAILMAVNFFVIKAVKNRNDNDENKD